MSEITGLYQNLALTTLVAKRPRGAFLAPVIFPALNVPKMSGTIYRLPMGGNIPHDTYRAPGTEAKVLWEENPVTEPFTIRDHSLSSLLPDEFRDIDTPLNEQINKVEMIVDALNLSREVEVVKKLVAAATASGNTEALTEPWDEATPTAGTDPLKYLISRIALILRKTGKRPNVIAMDYEVAAALFLHSSISERAKYTLNQTDMAPTTDVMARFLSASLGVPGVYIADTGWVSNEGRGVTNPELSKIWGDKVWLGLVERPSLEFGGFGLQLRYNGPGATYGKVVRNGYLVETSRVASRSSDAYYVHDYHDDVVVNPEAGYLITGTVTPE